MLTTHLRLAFRNILRQKTYAAINVFGLSVALVCCIFTFLFVRNEYSVNKNIPDWKRIYRIGSEWVQKARGIPETTLAPVGPTMARAYPEVESQTRLFLISATIHSGEKNFNENVIVTDSSFFDVFRFPLVSGTWRNALAHPLSLVITDELAVKIYGSTDVLGRTLRFDVWGGGQREYVITGVRKKVARNSITNFGGEDYDLILPFNATGDFINAEAGLSWDSRYILTFVKLVPGAQEKDVEDKLDSFIDAFAPPQYHGQLHLKLEPLRSIYLDDNDGSARRVCSILAMVASLILAIACVNFMNLTTARSLPRAKEIAMKTILGASRTQVIFQLLLESLIISLGAAILAVSAAEIGLRYFLHLFGTTLVPSGYWDLQVAAFVGLITLLVTILAGGYPALLLTSRQPVNALKGRVFSRTSATGIQPVLIVFQFAVAIILLIFVNLISQQLTFVTGRNLGFDESDVLVIDSVPREWSARGVARMTEVENQLRTIAGVSSVSLSFDTPTYTVANSVSLRPASWDSQQALSFPLYIVDESFADTYGITMREGRFFSVDHPSDSSGIVLNESAVSKLGLSQPNGALVVGSQGQQLHVIGVVKDFNFESLHNAIRPLAFLWMRNANLYRTFSLKLQGENIPALLGSIQRKWAEILPGAPFNYYFVSQRISTFYTGDRHLRDLLRLAAGLALLIASMGIYGLVFLNVAQRVKEIGIRKVLGASIRDILLVFTRDTVKWVLIANVVAWPAAYYLVVKWLAGFAYRTEVSAWIFVLSGSLAMFVALATIISHVIRAAQSNPVDALRYE